MDRFQNTCTRIGLYLKKKYSPVTCNRRKEKYGGRYKLLCRFVIQRY